VKLKGKVVLITGATSGIGKEIAYESHREGAHVIIHGRQEDLLKEMAKDLEERVDTICIDLLEDKTCEAFNTEVRKITTKIDSLVLNAGVAHYSPINQVKEEDFDRVFQVNVKSPYFLTQRISSFISNGGTVLFNSSVTRKKGYPGISTYSMSKAALVSLAKTLSSELVDRNIRVNVISPGIVDTDLFKKMNCSNFIGDAYVKGALVLTPMKRIGTASEVAKSFIYLMSDESSFITGTELCIDGGLAQV
jgi:NAD(P)-dependent dehydrogenase (short-subunit alcohol dehydrogenase family)